ncbi:MAG: type II toxin-antitoxin system VapC family toxin [Luteolibacter sp.]
MSLFPDTSFLCSLYRRQIHSPKAIRFMESIGGPLSVSGLLLFEFRQSIRFQMRLFSLDRKKGFSATEGERMLRDLESDLNDGVLKVTTVDWPDVHRIAENLSRGHTRERGHRFADLLHVATALHLGAEQFLTFDENQKILAEAEGMKVPV